MLLALALRCRREHLRPAVMPAWAGLPSGNRLHGQPSGSGSAAATPAARAAAQTPTRRDPASLPRTRRRDLKSDCSSGSELPVHSHNIVYAFVNNATRDATLVTTVVGALRSQWSVRIDSVVPSDAQRCSVARRRRRRRRRRAVGMYANGISLRSARLVRRLTRRVSTHDSIMTHRRRDA